MIGGHLRLTKSFFFLNKASQVGEHVISLPPPPQSHGPVVSANGNGCF